MKDLLKLLVLVFGLLGCGDASQFQGQKENEVETEETDIAKLVEGNFAVVGYVSPINITVDGNQYLDGEDFYTQETERLTKMVHEQYPDHNLFFDAEVGMRDFKRGLSVYLVAASESGLASESLVDNTGKFSFDFSKQVQESEKDNIYIFRAYKRIGLRLVKDSEVISWCYNFFAENQVALDGKPLILRKFQTKITSYKCNQKQESSGIHLPVPYVKEAFDANEKDVGYGPTKETLSIEPDVKTKENDE